MAIVAVPPFTIPGLQGQAAGAPGYTADTMAASGARVAMLIGIDQAGTLDWFEFRTGAVTNNPDNGIRFSFQNINPADGNPDGTQDQFRDWTGTLSANTWQVPPGVMTDDGTDGGAKRVVSAGDRLFCVVDFVSFVAGDSFQVTNYGVNTFLNYYVAVHNGSSWSKQIDVIPTIALKYADGTYKPVHPLGAVFPMATINTRTFNSGSTPDERAVRFTLDAPMRVAGVWVRIDLDAAADVVLYDTGGSVVASGSLLATERASTAGLPVFVPFVSRPTLTAGAVYRVAVKPTTTSNVSVYDYAVASAARLAGAPTGATWYSSTRTDAGSWTDDDTIVPSWTALVIDGIDDGTVTAGGAFPFFG